MSVACRSGRLLESTFAQDGVEAKVDVHFNKK